MAMRTLWVDSAFQIGVGNGGTHLQNMLTGVTADMGRLARMTLTRTIIGLDVAYTVHDAGEGSQLVSLGCAIQSQDSFGDAAATPDPSDQGSYPTLPWVWRAAFRVYGFAADQQAVFNRRIDLDIGAQRKLANGVSFMRIENKAQEGVASTITVTGFVRQLWLVA